MFLRNTVFLNVLQILPKNTMFLHIFGNLCENTMFSHVLLKSCKKHRVFTCFTKYCQKTLCFYMLPNLAKSIVFLHVLTKSCKKHCAFTCFTKCLFVYSAKELSLSSALREVNGFGSQLSRYGTFMSDLGLCSARHHIIIAFFDNFLQFFCLQENTFLCIYLFLHFVLNRKLNKQSPMPTMFFVIGSSNAFTVCFYR